MLVESHAGQPGCATAERAGRFLIGVDPGTVSTALAVAELSPDGALSRPRTSCVRHDGRPLQPFLDLYDGLPVGTIAGVVATGIHGDRLGAPAVGGLPEEIAQEWAARRLMPWPGPAAVVRIGGGGFSILARTGGGSVARETDRSSGVGSRAEALGGHGGVGPTSGDAPSDHWLYEKNDRCSAGTGQATERLCTRFGCSLDEAARMASASDRAVALTARCAVFAKSELTHFANQGVEHGRLFRGYFEAVAQTIAAHIARVADGLPVLLVGNGARIAPLTEALGRIVTGPLAVSTEAAAFDALGALWYAAAQVGPASGALAQEGMASRSGAQVQTASCAGGQVGTTGETPEWPERGAELIRARAARIRSQEPAAQGPGSVVQLGERPFLLHDSAAAARAGEAKESGGVAGGVETGESAVVAVLGLDLGSTGSKAALVDRDGAVLASVYRRTDGNPVEAARALVARIGEMTSASVVGIGLTGSGRDAVAAIMRAAFPEAGERLVVQNEIVAHATAAACLDPDGGRSLSIVEIGGQDAKFISVRDGRVVDSDMNRVCSAGTGSFLEEQATALGLDDIAGFGDMAARSTRPAELGQTCTVFVSDLVAEALADGYSNEDVFAGLQYSVIRNYRNRVMGQRRLLDRVFFQGKPASNPSLARTLAAVTGREVLVPPDPGAMGAIGIALLTARGLANVQNGAEPPERRGSAFRDAAEPLDLRRVLAARVVSRREGRCGDTACGNLCRIETAQVEVAGELRTVRSGGNCPKYEERAAGGKKLPRDAPNPFRARREWLARVLDEATGPAPRAGAALSGLTVAVPMAHYLIDLAPFFITFLARLGADVVATQPDETTLTLGDRLCGAVGACAPVKLAHGMAAAAIEAGSDAVFLPRLVNVPYPAAGDGRSTCPLAQGAPEMVRAALLERGGRVQVVMPALLLDQEDDLASELTRESLASAVTELVGGRRAAVKAAHAAALAAQRRYADGLRGIGEEALAFAARQGCPVVAVLGETHVIHDGSLNTGIHDLVAANGALALPFDCYPLPDGIPDLPRVHWASAGAMLRVALAARAAGTVFPLLIGAYGCGPNSFVEPLYADLLESYPHAVFETDGHGGLAGYVTRVQAFLHAVEEYRAAGGGPSPVDPGRLTRYVDPPAHSLLVNDADRVVFGTVGGTLGRQIAAALRGRGIPAEFAGATDASTMRAAQDSCSGKECLPFQLIAGGLERYFADSPASREGTTLFLSVGNGFRSCRANIFPVAARLTLERLGLEDRVAIGDLSLLTSDWRIMPVVWAALVTQDLLNAMRFHTMAAERTSGDVDHVFQTWQGVLERELEVPRRTDGVRGLVADARETIARIEAVVAGAARVFAAVPCDETRAAGLRDVLLAGDIFLRVDEWGNDDLQRRLAAQGLRVVGEPFAEFFELLAYREIQELPATSKLRWQRLATLRVMRSIVDRLLGAAQTAQPWLFWHDIAALEESSRELFAGLPFGETISTVGSVLLTWRTRPIDGVVAVAPRGCGPALIAEALLRRRPDIPVLYVYNDGDPIEQERLAGFAWRLRSRPRRVAADAASERVAAPPAAR